MALFGDENDGKELRIHEDADDLSDDLVPEMMALVGDEEDGKELRNHENADDLSNDLVQKKMALFGDENDGKELRDQENSDGLSNDLAQIVGDKMDGKELRIHENADDLSNDFAEYIAEISEYSIRERGIFTVALSGGSLISLMGKLCEPPYIKTVNWAKWHIFWVDERVVAKNHADSNYKLAKDGLFSKAPIIHSHVHSINDSVTAEQAAEDYEFVIRQLVRTRVISVSEIDDCPRFDLILLGMGPDGHVVSLFPNHSVVNDKDSWVAFITDSPKPPPERITFTFPVINSASNIAIVVTGGNKAEAVRLGLVDEIGLDDPELSVRKVRPVEGRLVWFLDREAASKRLDVKVSE